VVHVSRVVVKVAVEVQAVGLLRIPGSFGF
jgi:hypothetical protein